jgi:hypothetical protein
MPDTARPTTTRERHLLRTPMYHSFSLCVHLFSFSFVSLFLSLILSVKTTTADCALQTVHLYLYSYCRLWAVPTIALGTVMYKTDQMLVTFGMLAL